MLNRALPKEIRVLGWSPVEPIFNARCFQRLWSSLCPYGCLRVEEDLTGTRRVIDPGVGLGRFDATWREYKYFIVPGNDINIVAMQEAASQFVGIHDFRHFCKVWLRVSATSHRQSGQVARELNFLGRLGAMDRTDLLSLPAPNAAGCCECQQLCSPD